MTLIMLHGEDFTVSNNVQVLRWRSKLEQVNVHTETTSMCGLVQHISFQSLLEFAGQSLEFLRLYDPVILKVTDHLG